MMARFWYYGALAAGKFLQALPLTLVALAGRFGGAVAYGAGASRRRITLENLRRCFPDMAVKQLRSIGREHFMRIGENSASAIKTAGMSANQIARHLEIVGAEKLGANARGAVVAIGHFGNFELYTWIAAKTPHLRGAATYRALKQPLLDAVVRKLRNQSGCLFFNRRRDMKAMLRALREGGIILGLLSDQHVGRKGVRIPFFGHECSTSIAPAVLARRYDLPLFTAVCFRVALGRWRIEVGEEIARRTDAGPRDTGEIMSDVNAAFEIAVRRDPANWLWAHDRWRFGKESRAPETFPQRKPSPRQV